MKITEHAIGVDIFQWKPWIAYSEKTNVNITLTFTFFFCGRTETFLSWSTSALTWLSLSEAFMSKEVTEFALEGSLEVSQLESLLSKSPFVSDPLLSQDRSLGGLRFPSLINDLTLFIADLEIKFSIFF